MKSTRGGTNKPSFKIDTFNHYDDTKSGLLAVWYSMIQDSPPRTLNKDELKELESTLQELKAEINQHEQGKSEAGKPQKERIMTFVFWIQFKLLLELDVCSTFLLVNIIFTLFYLTRSE